MRFEEKRNSENLKRWGHNTTRNTEAYILIVEIACLIILKPDLVIYQYVDQLTTLSFNFLICKAGISYSIVIIPYNIVMKIK